MKMPTEELGKWAMNRFCDMTPRDHDDREGMDFARVASGRDLYWARVSQDHGYDDLITVRW